MTRFLNSILVLGIVSFWAFMNGSLVLREIDLRGQDDLRRGVSEFLGPELYRERWMGIYRNNRRIGHTGLIFEKVFTEEGDHHKTTVNAEFTVDLFGKGKRISVNGWITTDLSMLPLSLALTASFDKQEFRLSGERENDGFTVQIEREGAQLFEIPLPLRELSLTNGLTVDLPVAGLKVGQRFELPVFNPIFFQNSDVAVVTVEEQTRRRLPSGLNVDCFRLITKYQGQSSTSWLTADGEVLRQEVPHLGIVLRQETQRQAIKATKRIK